MKLSEIIEHTLVFTCSVEGDEDTFKGNSVSSVIEFTRDLHNCPMPTNNNRAEALIENLGFEIINARLKNAHKNGFGKTCRVVRSKRQQYYELMD